MWPLRRNVQYNKRCFFTEIVSFVLIIHLMLVGFLFVSDAGKFHQERFVLTSHNVESTVVFMPLKKRIAQQSEKSTITKAKHGTSRVISHHEYEKKLAEREKKQQKSIKNAAIKKQKTVQAPIKQGAATQIASVQKKSAKKSPTILQHDKQKKLQAEKSAKKAADLAKAASEKAKKAKKLAADKKSAAAAKAIADKAEIAKKLIAEKKLAEVEKKRAEEEKQKIAEQKLAEQKRNELERKIIEQKPTEQAKKEAKIAPVIEKEPELAKQELAIAQVSAPGIDEKIIENFVQDQTENLSNDISSKDVAQEEDMDLDHITFIGSHDLEIMQIKEQIQLEIVKYYKPPVGIAKTAVCELIVFIGRDGKAMRVHVKKGSGSMANDICARAALLKVQFPKEVIGKEITVALGQ